MKVTKNTMLSVLYSVRAEMEHSSTWPNQEETGFGWDLFPGLIKFHKYGEPVKTEGGSGIYGHEVEALYENTYISINETKDYLKKGKEMSVNYETVKMIYDEIMTIIMDEFE